MAGWRDLGITLIVAAGIGLSGKAAVAQDVRSRDGAFTATFQPPQDWCGQIVSVDVSGRAASFQRSLEGLQRFIGAVRASVTVDCPAAQGLRLRGHTPEGDAFLAYSLAWRDWRIDVIDARIPALEPLRAQADHPETLSDIARVFTIRLTARADVSDVTWATGPQQAVGAWSLLDVVGRTTALHALPDGMISPRSFADELGNEGVSACRQASGEDGDYIILDQGAAAFARGFTCRVAENSKSDAFLVAAEGAHVVVLSMAAGGDQGQANVRALTERFVRAIEPSQSSRTDRR